MKTIETDRLILREFQLNDLNNFYEYARNIHVASMLNWKPHINKEESLNFLKEYIKNDEVWAIALKENKKVIGHIKIYPDENRGKYSEMNKSKLITYALSEDYWGKGYMTEAIKRVVKYTFVEMNTELLTAFHIPDNIRSENVLKKCGFQYETTIKEGYKHYNGNLYDSIVYFILKCDYCSV